MLLLILWGYDSQNTFVKHMKCLSTIQMARVFSNNISESLFYYDNSIIIDSLEHDVNLMVESSLVLCPAL